MTTSRYQVTGMTCGHCVSAVTAEIGRIDGVSGVEVDLATGSVTVSSSGRLDDRLIAEAVDEAGYDLAGS